MEARVLTVLLLVAGLVVSQKDAVVKKKRSGETTTLHVSTTQPPLTSYLWNFFQQNVTSNSETITIVNNSKATDFNGTRFDGRWHLNVSQGSLTISDLTVRDSGLFQIQVFTELGTQQYNFNLKVEENCPTPVDALEGQNVTLKSGANKLDEPHHVKWTFGPDFGGVLIAEFKDNLTTVTKGYEDHLVLNPKDGSLTILNVTTDISGFYCVKIMWDKDPHILLQYGLTVYEPVSSPHVSETGLVEEGRRCSASCSVENSLGLTLSWYHEGNLVNRTSSQNLSINLSLPLEVQRPNASTFICEARNPVSSQTAALNSSQWCPEPEPGPLLGPGPDLKLGLIIGSTTAVVAVLGFVGTIVWIVRKKRLPKQTRGTNCFDMACLQAGPHISSQGSAETLLQYQNQNQNQTRNRGQIYQTLV